MFAKDELKRLLISPSRDATGSTSSTTPGNEGLGDVPFLLMYNKRDMIDQSMSIEELNGRLEVENYRD